MITKINSEDRLVQKTFADHLRDALGWGTVYGHDTETFGVNGTLGRSSEREAVLVRDLRAGRRRTERERTACRADREDPGADSGVVGGH